ncbi:MAG: serine hydrolase [Planctomycetota bacterium]|nr:serine hydrolase [Planctomycetota bacterium]
MKSSCLPCPSRTLPTLLAIALAAPLLGLGARSAWGDDPFDAVRDDMQAMIDEGASVGLVGFVQVEDKIVFQHSVGMRDREAGTKLELDSIFRIYSMTKPMTCAVALTFFEEGRFKLDDPVAKYLPQLAELKIKGKQGKDDQPLEFPMKVRDLFQHTTGWTYTTPWEREAKRTTEEPDLADLVSALGTLPVDFQPGSRWEYGISHDVLGHLIEVLANKPLDEVFRERIIKPLEMIDTGFHVDKMNLARLVTLYANSGQELVAVPGGLGNDPTRNPAWLSGGGGLFSTAADYLRFTSMMQAGGTLDGTRILKKETVALMTRDHIGDIPRSMLLFGRGFGLGVAVQTKATLGIAEGTWSWAGIAGTMFWVDPGKMQTILLMNQTWMDMGPGIRFMGKAGQALLSNAARDSGGK